MSFDALRPLLRPFLISLSVTVAALSGVRGDAATPASGTLTDTSGALTFTGGPFPAPNASSNGTPDGQPVCSGSGQDCDEYALTVNLPANFHDTHPNDNLVITVQFDQPVGVEDYDVFLHDGDGNPVKDSATSADPEVISVPACPGNKSYTIIVVPFSSGSAKYNAKVELKPGDAETVCPGLGNPDEDGDGALNPVDDCPDTPPGTVVDGRGCALVAVTLPTGTPRFHNFLSPDGVADGQGEPGLGCNRSSEKVFTNTNRDGTTNSIPNGGTGLYFGGFSTYMSKITFDDCSSPAGALWEKKTLVADNVTRVFGDPIIFTDNYDADGDGILDSGRTFVTQEVGLSPAGATIDITDNDGDTFTPSDGTVGGGVDHETVTAGPYHAPLPNGVNPIFPHAVYYASQSIAEAQLQRSDDGGLNFGQNVPMYTLAQCGGLHGHLKIANDGTIFVPNKGCGSTQAVIVSEDNGITFSIRKVPNALAGHDDDPSIGVATDSKTIYMGMQSPDGHPRIAVSHDKGLTWSAPVDVGATVVTGKPVLNTTFPAVVAGDPDRAAFAFFGTETDGANYNCGGDADSCSPAFLGVWYLYVATTFDGGTTWVTQNVTPGVPVQRGGICGGGPCRNQLDFFDAVIDKEGRVLVGWDTGCVGACQFQWPNSFTSKAEITRQTGGKRMYAAFDPVEPARALAPKLTATLDAGIGVVNLSWSVPDDSASPITGYKLYRRAEGDAEATLLASLTGTTYNDATIQEGVKYFYSVTAINGMGEGPFCHEIVPEVIPIGDVCTLPGVKRLTDDAGDQTGAADFDIQSVSVAEPFAQQGKIVFTMKMASLSANLAPGIRWALRFNGPNPPPSGEDDFFIMMTTENSTNPPEFVYGTTGVTSDPATGIVGARLFTIDGNLDAASNYATDGTIQLILPRNNPLIGPLVAGDTLTKIFPSVRAPATPANNGIYDQGGEFFYTLRDDHLCDVNTAPVAVLTATPNSGPAPLAVTLIGNESHDAEDAIVDYVFKFGDGQAVQQTRASVEHSYGAAGTYTATLTVRDARGLVSTVASQTVSVGDGVGGVTASAAPGNNVLGGSFSAGTLGILGLLAVRRRRKH